MDAVVTDSEDDQQHEEQLPLDAPAAAALEGLDVVDSEPGGPIIDVAEAGPSVDLRDPAPADEHSGAGSNGSAEPVDRPADPPMVNGPLAGKVAVVSGGGDGVGRAIALALLEAGTRVCLLGNDPARLRETIEIAGRQAPALYLQCDLGSVAEIESAADFIGRFDRPVDVLVHAAAVRVPQGISDGSIADLDEQYLVNLRGPYALTQKLMGSLSAGPGHVFLLDRPTVSEARDVQHAAIMAGLRTLAEGIRGELADTGVRVTTVTLDAGTDDADVAQCVVNAAEMSPRVEVSDLRVRVVQSDPPR